MRHGGGGGDLSPARRQAHGLPHGHLASFSETETEPTFLGECVLLQSPRCSGVIFFVFEVSSFLKGRQSSHKPVDVFYNSAIHLL